MQDDAALVEALDEVWGSIDELGSALTEDQWELATDCPGWSVKDNLAHIIGLERRLLGDPVPGTVSPQPSWVHNDLGRENEAWVASYRDWSGRDVLEEFRRVAGLRLSALSEPTYDFGAEAWTPLGPGTVRDLLPFRVFDSFVHEQDMRRAVRMTGGWDGAPAAAATDRVLGTLPYVLGKRVQPEDGTTFVLTLTDPPVLQRAIAIDAGRAVLLDLVPTEPTVALLMDRATLLRLSCGRGDAETLFDLGAVTAHGDEGLAHRIALALNVVT